MNNRHVWILGIAAATTCVSAFAATKVAGDYGKLPLTFEVNAGQTDARVKYLSRGPGYTLFLTANNEAVVSLTRRAQSKEDPQTAAVRMSLPGSKSARVIRALEPKETVSNYFYGNDPNRWLSDIRHFGRIAYEGVYPGIDVVYYGNQRQLEYDFIVAPGANPDRIRLQFDGADSVTKDDNGDLVLQTQHGSIRQLKPIVYQDIDGKRRFIAASYTVRDSNRVSFSIGDYDRTAKLVIDPVLTYSTFIGGTGVENGYAVAVDALQSAYVVGSTTSSNFPVASGVPGQIAYRGGASDAFVIKYTPTGNAIAFATYIGGSGADVATAVGIDTAGNIIVGGNTDSLNFPLSNAIQNALGVAPNAPTQKKDAFLLKIPSTGPAGLIYSTYLGGYEEDLLMGLAIHGESAIVCGSTNSTNFWSFRARQPFNAGGMDGWVLKMGAGGQLEWSTYLGGSRADSANGVAVDANGGVYVTGSTQSVNFPVTGGAFQQAINRPPSQFIEDAFVTRYNADGTAYVYSTYLGGTAYDEGIDIAVDAAENAFVAGNTQSVNFPVLNPLQGPPGSGDVFVTKLNATGTGLAFSTYLAGSAIDGVADIALDAQGNVYILGTTTSDNFPVTNPMQATRRGGNDLFITKIDAAGTARVWSTYLGGTSDDLGGGLALDEFANIYLTGSTISADYPRLMSHQVALSGAQDAFLTKIGGCDISVLPSGASFPPNTSLGSLTVNATNCPWFASSNDPWIVITGGASGVNSGIVNYQVEANAGIARTGTISVSGVLYTITQSGLSTGAPTVVGIIPNSGAGSSQVFTARYATPNPGGATIDRAYLLINTAVNGTGSCMVEFSPATNTFRLINNDGLSWTMPAIAGTGVVLSNSQCSLNLSGSSGTTTVGLGTLETVVNSSITFTAGFTGAKNVYLLANSEATGLSSGWIQTGTWNVTTGGGGGGVVGLASLVPTTGSSFSQTFTSVFTHSGGANQLYLGYTLFLPTPNVVNYTATGSCLVEYNRISNGMRLVNNAGTDWLGGASGIPLGTPGASLTNNYCTVYVQSATAFVGGNTMTVNIPVTFYTALGPVLGTFLQAVDVNDVWTGMNQFGNWVLPGGTPQRSGPSIVNILPTSGAGNAVTYSLTAAHPAGTTALTQMHLLMSDRIVGGLPCQVVYMPGSNVLNLVNDTGTALVSPTGISPGTPGIISNSRCGLNTGLASVATSGVNITVNLPLTFAPGTFGGAKGVYGIAFDNSGLTTHWVQGATFTVQ